MRITLHPFPNLGKCAKTDDFNQACDSFLHIFMDIFNKHCPVNKVPQISFEKKPGSPKV